jgi:hypothetical protein
MCEFCEGLLGFVSALLVLGYGYGYGCECGGRGLRFGMPPLGTRRWFLCRGFSLGRLMSLALKADC